MSENAPCCAPTVDTPPTVTVIPTYRVNFIGPDNQQRSLFGAPAWLGGDYGNVQRQAEVRATELGWTGFRVVSIQVCQPDVATF